MSIRDGVKAALLEAINPTVLSDLPTPTDVRIDQTSDADAMP